MPMRTIPKEDAMRSILKAIAAMSSGFFVLSMSLPDATLAINNLAEDLKQQAADERADSMSGAGKEEERPPEGVSIVRGEVLRIKRNNYLVRKYTGDVLHLYPDGNTVMNGRARPGDRIVAMVDDQRHVLLIHQDQ